jgi:uncharacterized protein
MKMFKNLYRLLKKYSLLALRSNNTPHHIALGVAIGLCCGVAIPIGQMLLAILLAYLFNCSKFFAIAATFISNPYTTPIIYPIFCYIGAKILGINLTLTQIKKYLHEIVTAFSWEKLFDMGSDLLLSYLIGGILIGLILGIIGYFVTYRILIVHKKIKKVRLKKKNIKNKNSIY